MKDVISNPWAELYITRDVGSKVAGARFFYRPVGYVYVVDSSYHIVRINSSSALSIRTDVNDVLAKLDEHSVCINHILKAGSYSVQTRALHVQN